MDHSLMSNERLELRMSSDVVAKRWFPASTYATTYSVCIYASRV